MRWVMVPLARFQTYGRRDIAQWLGPGKRERLELKRFCTDDNRAYCYSFSDYILDWVWLGVIC